jgi:phospholipid/cholesterol/gamma-HCH transport system substrate-binding protein
VLPLGQTREAVTIDHVLSTFDRRTRRDLRRLLRGLGRGLDHRGEDLNRFFEASAALAEEGGPVARVLREERAQVGTLIDDFGRVMAALGDREQDIRLLARQGKLAAEAVASRDRQLGETLEELPATVRQVRGTATRLASFSHLATPVLGDMRIAFEDLAPAVRVLRPAAAAGRRTVRELGGFARQAIPLLVNLRRFSNRGAKSVPPLDRFLGEYGPFARYAAPYHREFAAFFSNTRSSVGTLVDPGRVARIHFVISESTYAASQGEERRAYDALLSTGLLSTTRSVGKNPYPAPGTLGDPRPFEGNYTRVEADD